MAPGAPGAGRCAWADPPMHSAAQTDNSAAAHSRVPKTLLNMRLLLPLLRYRQTLGTRAAHRSNGAARAHPLEDERSEGRASNPLGCQRDATASIRCSI